MWLIPYTPYMFSKLLIKNQTPKEMPSPYRCSLIFKCYVVFCCIVFASLK